MFPSIFCFDRGTYLVTLWLGHPARISTLALLLACAACGDDSDSDDGNGRGSGGQGSGTPCQSGVVIECIRGGCRGIQTCGADGFLLPCNCPPGGQPGGPGDSGAPRDGSTMMPRDSGDDPRDAAPSDAASPDAASDGATENCNNDRDDDGDGDDDCADSDCSARTCVAAPPSGDWFGPVLLYEGDDAPPACSAGYPSEAVRGGTGVTATPATCSACTCTPDDPGCASFVNFETSLSTTCGAAAGGTCSFPVNSNCQELNSPCLNQATGYVESLLPDAPPTCMPSPQQSTKSAADWDRHALACAADDDLARAGCGNDELCAPARPFDGELCIYHYFDVPCPAGPYSDRRVYGTMIADTRDCSECACSHDCDYTWRVFGDADTTCTGAAVATLTEQNQCTAVSPGAVTATGGRLRVSTSIAGTGACTPSGGTATGSAQAQNPVTVCCLP
jgi:hypothetical protein